MREAKFTVRKEEGRSKPWCLEVSAVNSETGKRQRLFFKTKDEALIKQSELRSSQRQHGETYRSLPPAVVADVTRALKIMEDWPDATLLDAAKLFAEQRYLEERSDTIAEVLDVYYEEKETKRSPRYVNQIDQVRNRLNARAGDLPVSMLDATALEEILDEESVWTRNANARILKAAIRLAFARDRVPADVSKKILLTETAKSETEILTLEQAKKLMAACDERSAPVFAIRLFAGVRAEETVRLPVEDIDVEKGEIYIRDYVSKVRGHDRTISMEANLKAWLKRYPPGETLIPAGWEKIWDDVREQAGLKEDWHQNVLRHSYSAYWLEHNESMDKLAKNLGHFSGLQTLRRHYYRTVDNSDAAKFWSINPAR